MAPYRRGVIIGSVRIVLSRKGFDSANGGVASPVLPGGRIVSLPIPSKAAPVSYRDIRVNGEELGPMVEGLTRGRVKRADRAHLDPDLARGAIPRLPGWRAAFGQIDSAQSHLAARGVTVGDLFLFFGWFREVEAVAGAWRYRADAPDRHVVFGWLSIGEVIPIGADPVAALRRHPWLRSHPHVHLGPSRSNNTIYVASERLRLPGARRDVAGAGVFEAVHGGVVLTKRAQPRRSLWHLPSWFWPSEGRGSLSYHRDEKRWRRRGTGVDLTTVGRGQEFVLDCADHPEAIPWAMEIVERNTRQRAVPVASGRGRDARVPTGRGVATGPRRAPP